MKTVFIILSLLGCDDAVQSCDVLASPARTYQSEAACRAASLTLLEEAVDRPYPTIVAQCGTREETLAFLETVAPGQQHEIAVASLEPER